MPASGTTREKGSHGLSLAKASLKGPAADAVAWYPRTPASRRPERPASRQSGMCADRPQSRQGSCGEKMRRATDSRHQMMQRQLMLLQTMGPSAGMGPIATVGTSAAGSDALDTFLQAKSAGSRARPHSAPSGDIKALQKETTEPLLAQGASATAEAGSVLNQRPCSASMPTQRYEEQPKPHFEKVPPQQRPHSAPTGYTAEQKVLRAQLAAQRPASASKTVNGIFYQTSYQNGFNEASGIAKCLLSSQCRQRPGKSPAQLIEPPRSKYVCKSGH